MKNKKWTILLSTTFLSSLLASQAMAADYSNHPLKSGIESAMKRGIIEQSENFMPDNEITRAEFASIIVKATGVSKVSTHQFLDVPRHHPHFLDIQKSYEAKLIFGYSEKEFRPDKKLTREEMALMIMRLTNSIGLPIPAGQAQSFNDNSKMMYPSIISDSRKLGIVAGYEDNTFRPKSHITKAEGITFLIRSINKIDKYFTGYQFVDGVLKPTSEQAKTETAIAPTYKVYFRTKTPIETNSLQQALGFYQNSKEDSYIEANGEIIKLSKGFARTNAFTLIYDEATNKDVTYVASDVELEVLDIMGDKVRVSIGGYVGYVFKTNITLIPYIKTHERSYYMSEGNYLYHRIYKDGRYVGYKLGNAPLFMEKGLPYHTFEGYVFDQQELYQYFNYLPLRTQTSYTGAELDAYIASKSPDSPLNGYGQVFVDAANKYNLNAMYLLANAIHESGWGKSEIALKKNNLFGFKAVDASAFESAASFATLAEGIDYCAKYISDRYLTPGVWTYNNAILGNKGKGMNVKYASDPYWGSKIAAHMFEMDEYLGKKDFQKYTVGKIAKGVVPFVKSGSSLIPVKAFDSERVIAVQGIETINAKDYIKAFSDDNQYEAIYIPFMQFRQITTY